MLMFWMVLFKGVRDEYRFSVYVMLLESVVVMFMKIFSLLSLSLSFMFGKLLMFILKLIFGGGILLKLKFSFRRLFVILDDIFWM